MNGLTSRPGNHTKFLPIVILIVVLVFTLLSWHPMINSDSVNGFDAMKGFDWTGKFNTLLYYNPDTRKLETKFLTWWSPGQYLAPLFFIKWFHVHMGTAVTLVNLLGSFLGITGYYLIFRKYHFSGMTIWISVLLILFSSTVLQRYYLYDGGESLNLMVFPWIIVFQRLMLGKYGKWIYPGIVLYIAFICKLQMIIIVPPLLFLLMATSLKKLDFIFNWSKPFGAKELKTAIIALIPFLLSLVLAYAIIYFDFLAKGVTPASLSKQLSLDPKNILFPIASPVTSVYLFDSFAAYLKVRPAWQNLYLLLITLMVFFWFFRLIRHFNRFEPVKRNFIIITSLLFLTSVLVFAVLYSAGSAIDFSTRHFKLTSFLLYPLMVEQGLRRLNKTVIFGFLSVFCLFALGNHLRLLRKWMVNTSVTPSGLRLTETDMPLHQKLDLDARIHSKTLVISPYNGLYAIDNPLILAIPGGAGEQKILTKSGYPVVLVDSLR